MASGAAGRSSPGREAAAFFGNGSHQGQSENLHGFSTRQSGMSDRAAQGGRVHSYNTYA